MKDLAASDEFTSKFLPLLRYIRKYGSEGIKFSTGSIAEISYILAIKLNIIGFDSTNVEKMLTWLIATRHVQFVKLKIFYVQLFMHTELKPEELYEAYHESP